MGSLRCCVILILFLLMLFPCKFLSATSFPVSSYIASSISSKSATFGTLCNFFFVFFFLTAVVFDMILCFFTLFVIYINIANLFNFQKSVTLLHKKLYSFFSSYLLISVLILFLEEILLFISYLWASSHYQLSPSIFI